MKHRHEQSTRIAARASLSMGGSEYVEPAEDHHKNDEAPEDHCRDEEGQAAFHESTRRIFSGAAEDPHN
jgi:hypothetical protein